MAVSCISPTLPASAAASLQATPGCSSTTGERASTSFPVIRMKPHRESDLCTPCHRRSGRGVAHQHSYSGRGRTPATAIPGADCGTAAHRRLDPAAAQESPALECGSDRRRRLSPRRRDPDAGSGRHRPAHQRALRRCGPDLAAGWGPVSVIAIEPDGARRARGGSPRWHRHRDR